MSFDVFVEIAKEERKYFENYIEYAKKIKGIAEKLLGDVEVLVFGFSGGGEAHTCEVT